MYGKPNVSQKVTVTTTTPVTITTGGEDIPIVTPLVLSAIPGATGTLLVEYQVAPDGLWIEWPAGDVATTTVYVLTAPVYALRFTATTDDGIVEIAQ